MAKQKKKQMVIYFLIIAFVYILTGCTNNPEITQSTEEPTRDLALENEIIAELEQINPDAVPVYKEATVLLDAGEDDDAKLLYEKVAELAPEFSTAYRRLGQIELTRNNIDEATNMSRKAVELDANPYNKNALALVLLQKNTPRDSQEAFNLASDAIKKIPDDEYANMVLVMAAGAVNRIDVMREANEHLLLIAPGNPLAHYYAGLLAAQDGKWLKAEQELLISKQLGTSPEAIQEALDSGIARYAMFIRLLQWGGIATILWLLGFGVLYLLGSVLSKTTLKAINSSRAETEIHLSRGERNVRSIYRVLITALSFYFYVSIPFVIILLFVVVGGVFYLFFLIGRIPVQLAGILVIVLIVSLLAVARALFTKMKESMPGRELKKTDAPKLWSVVENIAQKLDVRAVDAIYITPGVGIAVNERGSIIQKIRGAGKRNLILGMGVLSGLTQGQFSAILAHEYGHFSNRDTAGGNLAHQAYASLDELAHRLVRGGAAQPYNPVWLFVLGYQRVYLRVTLGASRLQEVLADRYAALAYGGENFIEGLKSVIRESIAFQIYANSEVRRSLELKQPISNLYNSSMPENLLDELEKNFDAAMNRATSEYDSHPAPKERVAWIKDLKTPFSPIYDNNLPVLDLFPKIEELQRDMTVEIMMNVKR